MAQKKKYPTIKPKFLKDKAGKIVEVYLDYNVYESIFDEIESLKNKTKDLKKKKLKKA